MRPILIGQDDDTGEDVRIPSNAFGTHMHLIGGTGKGKTTAIHTMLHSLLSDPLSKPPFFLIDRFGSFSQELLLWMASPHYCPQHVRDRLVYIQGANEDIVPTLNPLTFSTPGECYFKVERATEIILRAWESQDIAVMPRLARWTFNAFMAAAHLGLTISDCVHFLMPGSPHHATLLRLLPPMLEAEWREMKGTEAVRTLDSSRNRLKPYFDSVILRRMFGSIRSRLDVGRFMDEGRIVLIDLAPRNRLSPQLANTIGALVINEIIATIRSRVPDVRQQTYLFLDEFQNFVGPDVESALPEMRQMGLNLILSHQSFSQLKRGDYDMTNMIFAAQSRMIFGVQGMDADILAHEVASLTFDPMRIKDERWSRRQLIKGHRIINLNSWSESEGLADQWSKSIGRNLGNSRGESSRQSTFGDPVISRTQQEGETKGEASGGSFTRNNTKGTHEAMLPEYEQFMELAARTYQGFDEQRSVWARDIRRLRTGQALLRLVNDDRLYPVNVKKSTPGYLAYDVPTIRQRFPQIYDAMQEMVERNYESDVFASAAAIDREAETRLLRIANSPIVVNSVESGASEENVSSEAFGI